MLNIAHSVVTITVMIITIAGIVAIRTDGVNVALIVLNVSLLNLLYLNLVVLNLVCH